MFQQTTRARPMMGILPGDQPDYGMGDFPMGRPKGLPQPFPPGLFGSSRRAPDTANTTPQRGSDVAMGAHPVTANVVETGGPAPAANLPVPGEAAPNHWSVEQFDKLRSAIPPRPPRPTGLLGQSARRPFDYDAALEKLAGNQKKIKDWRWVVAGLGAALGDPSGLRSLFGERDSRRQRMHEAEKTLLGWQYKDYERQNEADLRASNPFTIGRDRVMYDPATGEAHTIYDGAEDFELYAQKLGLEPGSPEYFQAVEDFVLRSSGPSAHERDIEMDDHRTGNDRSLESLRYGNRASLENLRQGNRRGMVDYRNANPPPTRSRRSARPTATGPNGQKIEWDGKAWVPVK